MTDTLDPQRTTTLRIVEYVQALLRHSLADEEARRERIRGLEQAGHRIVSGGQTGQATWEITDWRTGQLIESGSGGYDAFDAAAQRIDPDGTWVHIDQLSSLEEQPDAEAEAAPAGIPASLAEALQDWLGSPSTSDEDVAQFVAWDVEEVSRHRESD